jgi:hypothetical protein
MPCHSRRNGFRVWPFGCSHRTKRLNDLALPLLRHVPAAVERRKHFLMPKVLAPRLELPRRLALLLPELNERVPQAVRVEVVEPGRLERRESIRNVVHGRFALALASFRKVRDWRLIHSLSGL